MRHLPRKHRFFTATGSLQASFTTRQAFAPETAVRPPVALCSLSGRFLTRHEPTTTASQHRSVPSRVLSGSSPARTPQTQTPCLVRVEQSETLAVSGLITGRDGELVKAVLSLTS